MADILSTYDLAVLFMATIKATAAITAVFGDDIREANWQNTNFAYPALRLEIGQMKETPLNGNCKGKWFDIIVSTYIFTEGTSTKECQQYMKIVANRFKNASIGDATLQSQPLVVDYMPVVTDNFNHHRGEVVISGKVHET